MIKSRLIEVLKTFSKKDFRECKKWVNSPFHNQRKDVVLLFDYLTDPKHLMDDNLLEKQLVFPSIYPDEAYDDSKMRQVMHFLFRSVEDFLVYQENEHTGIRKKLSLLKVYKEKNLDRSFVKTQKDLENDFHKSHFLNEDYEHDRYVFLREVGDYNSKVKRTQELNIQRLSDTFDQAFIIEKLKQACLALTYQKVFNKSQEIGFLDKVLEIVEANNLFDNHRIGIQYHLYQILKNGRIENFFTLKKYLAADFPMPIKEIRESYISAINFCISQINMGNRDFRRELFQLYKNGIAKNIFLENQVLSRWTFKNAITIALNLKEFDWVENFIENYNQYLKEKHRKNFLYFNYAKLHYEKGNHDKALEVIQKYEFSDVLININAKILLTKIFYELSEFNALESLLESMRAYIQRKKELGSQRMAIHKNFIKYTKKLLRVNPYSKAQKEKLKTEIEAAKPLTEKAWLLKQLSEL